jgi:putative PIN family toxin of toxin-antitoxin system
VNVVIDTNVLVSGLINPYGTSALIVGLMLEERITPCYDARILIEYADVLGRKKFEFDKKEITGLLDFVRDSGIGVVPAAVDFRLKDPDDMPFLEVAVTSQARYLITGNTLHFPRRVGRAEIVSPSSFLSAFFPK